MRWCLLLMGLWVLSPCWGQPVTFHKVFDVDEAPEVPLGIITIDDGYVMCGFGSTVRTEGWGTINVIKTDKLGQLLWSKQYGAPHQTLNVYSSQSIIEVYDGYMIFGSYYDTITDNVNGYTLHIDQSGDSVSSIIYGSSAYRYAIFAAERSFDGGFFTVGVRTNPGNRAGQYWLQKLDSTGHVIWDTVYLAPRGNAYSILKNVDSTYTIGGIRFFPGSSYDASLMKIDQIGNIQWEHNYGTTNDDPCSAYASRCLNGDYLIWSCLDTVINTNDEPLVHFLSRVDSVGNIIWTKHYNVPNLQKQELWTAKENKDNIILVAGTKSFGMFPSTSWIEALDSSGNQLWERYYSLPPDSIDNHSYRFVRINDLEETDDNGIICAGIADVDRDPSPFYDTDIDFSLLKLDSLGIWHFPIDTSCPPPCDTVDPCPEPCDTVGISESFWEDIYIYPNPTSNQLFINTAGREGKFQLYSLVGELVLRQEIAGEASVDVSALPGGLYVYEILLDGERVWGKVMVR